VAKDLASLVTEFRLSLQNINYDSYITSAEKLYSLLISPIRENIKGKKKAYVIPDGILNYLPFEALITKHVPSKGDIDFSGLPYLINDFEICYHYSAHLLFLSSRKEVLEDNFSFLGFAPVFPDLEVSKTKISNLIDTTIITRTGLRSVTRKDKTYSSLPESEEEVKEIAKLFGSRGYDGKVYTYNDACEDKIKSGELGKFSSVHLATHGFINEETPKLSGLLFADNENSGEDGILYLGEIFNIDLKTNLVVLSACESGLGKLARGEGIIGLTRGFIYSGTKNLLVSLWQVADKSTSELMIEFYKNVLDRESYSSSLRAAKLKLIKDGVYSYPLEWSPFVLIGRN
jgi:CHAT domain-containing protein